MNDFKSVIFIQLIEKELIFINIIQLEHLILFIEMLFYFIISNDFCWDIYYMAKLYFYYSAMNAGKTTALLQSSYNYQERGMNVLVYTAAINVQDNKHKRIQSRIGLSSCAKIFDSYTNLFEQIKIIFHKKMIHCILIDECHFLNRRQVEDLAKIVDILNIPVLCYGLRTDFRAELFSGSLWLLAWADKLIELKTICYCGHKASRVLRINNQGLIVSKGSQIMVGNDKHYISMCRKHFLKFLKLQSLFPKKNVLLKNKHY